MTDYSTFLAAKLIRVAPIGLADAPALPAALRPFQRDITTWALRLGRAAIFAGTGLGKTITQLSWASAIRAHTGRPVLLLAPLAVAQQTVGEAEKFDIPSVAYAASGDVASTDIVMTNYDRVEKFDPSAFAGIVLDESSIIKAHESKTRRTLMEMFKDTPFKLCCTATPAPNDYVELGNHAEFLDVLTAKEMLATWFVHDGSMKAKNVKNHDTGPKPEWRLKGHAEQEFWAWLSTWAVMLRHPRELGYEEPGYDLPPLEKRQVTVHSNLPPARTLSERLRARRESIVPRVAAAAAIVNASRDRPWLVWCQLNDEAAACAAAIPGAIEVRGSHPPAYKIAVARWFQGLLCRCQIPVGNKPIASACTCGNPREVFRSLVSKASIFGWGLNFQCCADQVFVGLNDSFEQLFQALRRCWRFGQTRPVTAYMIASTAEGAVVANLDAKEAAAERMADEMSKYTRELMTQSVRGAREFTVHATQMEIPSWLR